MKKLRLGVIGTCCRGKLSDWAHQPENGVEIVAGADIYEMQRQGFLQRHKEKFQHTPNVYGDYKEMLEKEHLDGVFITTPDFLHEEIACYALEHKVPVYLEKPIAISIEGADRILKTAKKTGTRLLLGHNMRYMQFTRTMREIIQNGVIGDVKAIWCRHFISYGGDAYFRDWHADRAKTCSLLLQKGAHDIDIIHWLANSYTTRVSAMGSLSAYGDVPRRPKGQERLTGLDIGCVWTNAHWPVSDLKDFYPNVNNEDINMVNMRLENGVQACYLQCHFTPDAWRNYTVIGTKGRIENYGNSTDDSTVQVWTRRKDGYRQEGDITYKMIRDDDLASVSHGGADLLIVQSFIDMLRGKGTPDSTPQGARYAVATGVLAAQSLRSNSTPLDIPKLPRDLEKYDFSHNLKK